MQQIANHGHHCVGCGDGPGSLGLTFETDGERVRARLRLDERHQGAPGFAHGGMLATAMDDTIGTLLYVHKSPAVTANLQIDYRRPAFINTDYVVTAWTDRVEGRKLHLCSDIRDATDAVVAEARALFLVVDVAHFAQNGRDMPEHVKDLWKRGAKELPY